MRNNKKCTAGIPLELMLRLYDPYYIANYISTPSVDKTPRKPRTQRTCNATGHFSNISLLYACDMND